MRNTLALHSALLSAIIVSVLSVPPARAAPASPASSDQVQTGKAVYQRACVACHSLTPGKKLNGPSLASVWGRPIGKAPGYPFSAALSKVTGT